MDQSDQMMRRPVRAFLLTPVFAAFFYLLLTVISETAQSSDFLERFAARASSYLTLMPVATLVIGIVMVVFALPLYVLLRVLKLESVLITIVSAGTIVALIISILELYPYGGGSSYSAQVGDCQTVIDGLRTPCGWVMFGEFLALHVFSGLFGGAVFWRLYSGRWV